VRRLGIAPLRHRDTVLLRDQRQRLKERQPLVLHHEAENVAALAATEALKNLQPRMHRERWTLLRVKRAQPNPAIRSAFLQAHVVADNANDVDLTLNLLCEIHRP